MSTFTKPRIVNAMLIAAPFAHKPLPGHEFVDLNELGIFRKLMGADGGYHRSSSRPWKSSTPGVKRSWTCSPSR